ncbi:cupin domain-containing protein [Streptomyces sp. NPDC088744]|uniref:AraC family transcriptional regulator n=1 Tax=Streptomyces sp. NPDC088744 TaxID=3155061 RepID=UPI00344E7F73
MDVFDELLRGVRGRGAMFGRSVLWPPWSLHFTDGAYLTLCLPMRGAGWLVPEGGEPLRLTFGEAAIVRGPRPELTVAAVARRVGYADAFGFSAAFKRLRGESPSAYRREAAAAGARRSPPP